LAGATRADEELMKQTVLDVLLYIFENHLEDGDVPPNRDALQRDVVDAGFPAREVDKALVWIEALAAEHPLLPSSDPSRNTPIRVFSALECARLDTDCRGFLFFLENRGIIDATRRELIVNRVLALDEEEISLDDLKWVVLMVLFNQPDLEDSYAWMESLMFDCEPQCAH